jgi:predicted nucleic acid-binding protein
MTKIVIDSNIAFSAMLNVNSRIGQIIINGHKHYHFYSPEYIRFEILNHQVKIKEIAQLSDNEFLEVYELIFRNITILNHSIIPKKFYIQAKELCGSIDIDDTAFVAFTEYIRGKLWTGDKKLIKGLVKKDFLRLITTDELYQDFIQKEKLKNR